MFAMVILSRWCTDPLRLARLPRDEHQRRAARRRTHVKPGLGRNTELLAEWAHELQAEDR